VLHAVAQSQQQQGGQGQSSPGQKAKVSMADYPDDIKQYLRASLSAMSRMEVSTLEQSSVEQCRAEYGCVEQEGNQ
jgi:hypothetical protein